MDVNDGIGPYMKSNVCNKRSSMKLIRSWNNREQSQSQIKVIQSLTKVWGMQYNVIMCEMRVLCKYK